MSQMMPFNKSEFAMHTKAKAEGFYVTTVLGFVLIIRHSTSVRFRVGKIRDTVQLVTCTV
jgi:hypothetical protein